MPREALGAEAGRGGLGGRGLRRRGREARAVGMTAQRQGLAALERSHDELLTSARATITAARTATSLLMEHGIIPEPPQPSDS